jgi:hypothetical protein
MTASRTRKTTRHELIWVTQEIDQSGLGAPARWGRCSCKGWWFKSTLAPEIADANITDAYLGHLSDVARMRRVAAVDQLAARYEAQRDASITVEAHALLADRLGARDRWERYTEVVDEAVRVGVTDLRGAVSVDRALDALFEAVS